MGTVGKAISLACLVITSYGSSSLPRSWTSSGIGSSSLGISLKIGISGILDAVFFHSGSLGGLISDNTEISFKLLRGSTFGWGIKSGFLFTGISGYFSFIDLFCFLLDFLEPLEEISITGAVVSIMTPTNYSSVAFKAICSMAICFSESEMLPRIGFGILLFVSMD